MRLLFVVLVAIAGSVSCGQSAEPFRAVVEEEMDLDNALHALRTTAAERPRSWLAIYFECHVAADSEVVMGWDKESRGLKGVEITEIGSALTRCESVTVWIRGLKHASSFSFDLDSDERIQNLSTVDAGAAV